MRLLFSLVLVGMLLLVGAATSLQAQAIPDGMGIDSSLRVEYLVGTQIVKSTDAPEESTDRFGVRFNPSLALLAGSVELSPFPFASGRFAGAVSIVEPEMSTVRQLSRSGSEYEWKARPDFGYWEVAGLYHLSSGGGYRFSLTGGYRQSTWDYTGAPEVGSGSLRDKYVSYIPFIGLQTAMMFPWWKARFEVLGSPFMSKKSLVSMSLDSTEVRQNIQSNAGGLVEFQMEGTVNFRSNFWIGLYGRYHYQEMYGNSSGGTNPPAASNYADRFYSRESYGSVGLNLTAVY